MSESVVDLTYRGLAIGKRVKLTQVRPSTGFVELATPMPVGTSISITNDEGVTFDAFVQESIEQVSGRELAAGMTLRPRLDGDAATWWKSLVALPDVVKVEAAPVVGIVRSKRNSNAGIPELMDDGRNTAVQEAVDPAKLGVETEPEPEKDTQVIPVIDTPIVDDGRATTAMDAIDLAALGLSASGEIPIVKEVDDDGDVKSGPAGNKKKKRRR